MVALPAKKCHVTFSHSVRAIHYGTKNMQHNPYPSYFTSLFETISIISHEDFNREF